jgi:hypothetical protein
MPINNTEIGLPPTEGQDGKLLTVIGGEAVWAVDGGNVPDPTGQDGKFLTVVADVAQWGDLGVVGVPDASGQADGDTLVVGAGVPVWKTRRSGSAVVDFGTIAATLGDDSLTSTTISGLLWVTASSFIMLHTGEDTVDHTAEDAAVERIQLRVGDVVPGDGFTIYAAAPEGSYGTYNISWLEI